MTVAETAQAGRGLLPYQSRLGSLPLTQSLRPAPKGTGTLKIAWSIRHQEWLVSLVMDKSRVGVGRPQLLLLARPASS